MQRWHQQLPPLHPLLLLLLAFSFRVRVLPFALKAAFAMLATLLQQPSAFARVAAVLRGLSTAQVGQALASDPSEFSTQFAVAVAAGVTAGTSTASC